MQKNTKRNIFNRKNNPFAKECTDCIKNIWDSIKHQADILDKQCYPNTYVWIEKFKDDNKII